MALRYVFVSFAGDDIEISDGIRSRTSNRHIDVLDTDINVDTVCGTSTTITFSVSQALCLGGCDIHDFNNVCNHMQSDGWDRIGGGMSGAEFRNGTHFVFRKDIT